MTNLLWILTIACCIYLFWQQRRQSELARLQVERRCQQVNVQLVSFARGNYKFRLPPEPLVQTHYLFEFSVNGIDCYQGYATMQGLRLVTINMPAYPLN